MKRYIHISENSITVGGHFGSGHTDNANTYLLKETNKYQQSDLTPALIVMKYK